MPSDAAAAAPVDHSQTGHPQRWFILGILCTCLVLIVAAVSSLNIAIPSIQESLDATQTELQWIVDSYALVFAGLLLPAGALGDRYGRKWMLLGGLGLYGIGAVVAATSGSASQLIAMRAVMGVGAAAIMPATLSLLTSVFPPHERPKAIAIWAGFAGAGGAIGVISSGFLLEHFWWGSVFFITVPIVAVAMIAIFAIVPNSKDPAGHPLDPFGSVLSIVGLVALVFAIIEGPERGWTDTLVVGGFVLAVVALTAFVQWERKATFPMLDPAYFRIPRFAMSAATITIVFFAMFSMFFAVSQYFQFVRDYSPLKTGLATLPSAITMIIVAPRGPRVQQRITVRYTMAIGLGLLAVGIGMMALVQRDSNYLLLGAALVVMAAGVGLATPSATTGIMASLPMSKAGVGSAVNDTTREVGGAVGIAVVGSVLASVYRAGIGDATAMLPPQAADAAHDNIGAAVTVGKEVLGGDPGALQRYLDIVGNAFTDGFNAGMAVASVFALLGGIAILVWYPRGLRPGDRVPTAVTGGAHADGHGDVHPNLDDEVALAARASDVALTTVPPSGDELAEATEGSGGVGSDR
jgi:EmrB/QacA subfamily drug resistance transporter